MTQLVLIQKIQQLPDPIQSHVLEYLEFVFSKYLPELPLEVRDPNDYELSEEGKRILDQRIKNHEANPDKAMTWDQYKQKLKEERGYDL